MVLPRKSPKRRLFLRNLFQPTMIEDLIRRAHDGDIILHTKKGQQQPGAIHRLTRMRVQLFTLLVMIGITAAAVLYVIPHDHKRTSSVKIPPSPARRFPEFGTSEFAQKCPWVVAASNSNSHNNNNNNHCITYVTPNPESHEGVAEWVTKIVIGYIDAKIRGCNLLLDYGRAIDIRQVLDPVSFDWTVPKDFECFEGPSNCWTTAKKVSHNILTKEQWKRGIQLEPSGIHIPNYRHAFKNMKMLYNIHRDQFIDLEKALPGFELESGMACSLGSVLGLAAAAPQQQASNFQQDVFTRILPILRDENTLVVTLYVRTGRTDRVADAEKAGTIAQEDADFEIMPEVQTAMKCAHQLESKYLEESKLSAGGAAAYTRVAWLLVSDSFPLKSWINDNYHGQNSAPGAIPRVVVTTTSRGMHTRATRDPSTADFAEAMIDWFLMGESDIVVTSSPKIYSFGVTAAQRTNARLYNAEDCSEMKLIHDGLAPDWSIPKD
jgi:hypothetical protein